MVGRRRKVLLLGGGGGVPNNPTLTGIVTAAGARVTPASAMGGTVVDVTKLDNTYSASGDATLTFSATPSAGTVFGLTITTDGTARTITVPSSKSANRGATITSFVVPANATITVYWRYDGSTYHILGDPVTAAQARTALELGNASLGNVPADGFDASAGEIVKGSDSRLTNARTPTSHVHSADDITSGTLPVARGGTGTTTPSLVAGTNITVTGTWPNQTINSTGGGSGSSAHVMSGGVAATVYDFLETIAGGSASTDFTNLPVVHGSNASVSFA